MATLLTDDKLPDWYGPLTLEHGVYAPEVLREDRYDNNDYRGAKPGPDAGGCLLCGRRLKEGKSWFVFCHGGAPDVFVPANLVPSEMDALENEPGMMGVYGIGSRCAAKVRRAIREVGKDPANYVWQGDAPVAKPAPKPVTDVDEVHKMTRALAEAIEKFNAECLYNEETDVGDAWELLKRVHRDCRLICDGKAAPLPQETATLPTAFEQAIAEACGEGPLTVATADGT